MCRVAARALPLPRAKESLILPGATARDTPESEVLANMADVLALVDDLFFQVKLAETARHVGVTLQTVSTGEALTRAAKIDVPRLVIVDLNARAGPIEALEQMCGGETAQRDTRGPQDAQNGASANQVDGSVRVPVIAFLSHVQTALADRARAAGCTNVLPRSKFTADLAQILHRAKP